MSGAPVSDNQQRNNATIPEVLSAIGALMADCRREALALQDVISEALPSRGVDLSAATTYQRLDYVTQVHEELSRLLPALADAIDNGNGNTDGLASSLHLDSLRDRLFGKREADHRPNTTEHGIVDFF